MNVIIAGSRHLLGMTPEIGEAAARLTRRTGAHIGMVISGGAPGVDESGEQWARHHYIPVERYPADWKKHGKAAGPLRNKEMAIRADALILVWDGRSRGSASMKREAEARDLHIEEVLM